MVLCASLLTSCGDTKHAVRSLEPVAWASEAPVSLDEAIGDVRTAIIQWDAQAMARAASGVASSTDAGPEGAYYRGLWRGAALFHAVLALSDSQVDTSADLRTSLRDQAIEALTAVLAQRPDDSDSHAMLAVLYGRQIRGRLVAAMRLGPLVAEHRQAARRAQDTNPRVNYLEGVSLLTQARNPEQLSKALEALRAAETLFKAEAVATRDSREPDWGRAHNMMFMGQAYQRLGRLTEAMAAYQQAMRLVPNLERAKRGYESCRQATQDR